MYSVVLMMALSGGTDAIDHHRCHGCAGSACSGAVVAPACSGSCHGRARLFGGHRCHGCTGTACTGSSCHGCRGGLFHRNRCHGCHGAVVCSGAVGCCGGVVVPGGPGGGPEKIKDMPKEKKVSAPATILVRLPAGATLRVDGTATSQTSEQRTLVTPALSTSETFVYTLEAELNGQVQTQDILVRGGQTTQAQFNFTTGAVAAR